jgi:drug/metabolite transporter (DMT)-like permease
MSLLASLAGSVPPLELLCLTFSVSTLMMLVVWAARGFNPLTLLRQPLGAWGSGIGAFFGYHFLFFLAVQRAPVLDASLINYLWPLLIVLFSALLPGSRLRGRHVVGAFLGLAGTWVLLAGGRSHGVGGHPVGDLAAGAAAVTWAAYSVFNRRYREVPTVIVGAFCAATALLAGLVHGFLEPTVIPLGIQWLAILGIGLGPVGAAFLAWDHGVKHGDIRMLGILSYAAPVLSSLLLVATGRAQATAATVTACLLVTAGATLGAHSGLASRIAPEQRSPRGGSLRPRVDGLVSRDTGRRIGDRGGRFGKGPKYLLLGAC